MHTFWWTVPDLCLIYSCFYAELCIGIDSFIWWMSHFILGLMKSHHNLHLMKSCFDEKPPHSINSINQPAQLVLILWQNYKKAISARVLYDTGADISCISSRLFHTLPPDCWPMQRPGLNQPCWGANWWNRSIMGSRHKFQIGAVTIMHPIQVIKNLHEEAIIGIDFVIKHQLTHDPKLQCFAWGTSPWWCSRHAKVAKDTMLMPCSIATVKVNLITEGGSIPGQQGNCLIHVPGQDQPYLLWGTLLGPAQPPGSGHDPYLHLHPNRDQTHERRCHRHPGKNWWAGMPWDQARPRPPSLLKTQW